MIYQGSRAHARAWDKYETQKQLDALSTAQLRTVLATSDNEEEQDAAFEILKAREREGLTF